MYNHTTKAIPTENNSCLQNTRRQFSKKSLDKSLVKETEQKKAIQTE